MIAKQVQFLMDEATNVAKLGDNYFVFDEGDAFRPIEVAEALQIYIAANAKIPGDFGAIRDIVAALL